MKVIIKNWPTTPWYQDWKLIIALIALVASLASLYWTRKDFVKSSRPFVWASNYGVIDSNNTMIPVPSRVGCRVKNSPAKIIRQELKIFLNKEEIFSFKKENLVRFPDDKSEWTINIGKDDWDKIMNLSSENLPMLVRVISLEYSSLDGGKVYHYKLEQSFNLLEKQWTDTSENAD